ncbi:MAG: diacylglycerol kinase [Notoacmeibacter sp.]
MERIINAFGNSMRALKHLSGHEKAVQQELVLLLVATPLGWFLAPSFGFYLLMMASILVILLVEILNTGIEAACDAISRELHDDIRIAKDSGSLAVLISLILASGVWLYAIWLRFFV